VANKKFIVALNGEERARLKQLISKGKASAKAILKARILLKADQGESGEGWSDTEICEALDTNASTRVREKLVTHGLEAVLARYKVRVARDPLGQAPPTSSLRPHFLRALDPLHAHRLPITKPAKADRSMGLCAR
jgi:hypothetical protein